MRSKKVWFITGAGRGMGVDFAKAALAAGNAVVASGRDPDAVSKVLGQSDDLLTVKLDVTKRGDAEAAVRAAVDRSLGYGRKWETCWVGTTLHRGRTCEINSTEFCGAGRTTSVTGRGRWPIEPKTITFMSANNTS
jgi:NAD(P)-dependent dehydrogenase (short-subunit alcohol dehydrogenase family)